MSELDKFAERYEADIDHVRRWVIEAMVLGAAADGEFDRRESDEIIRVVAENAEFIGMSMDELKVDLERAFEGIVKDGIPVRLHALAGALPRYAHRVLAFRCAVKIAFANGELATEEISFLREMQKVLGISEADVTRAFDEGQGPIAMDALPQEIEPVEAYLDCLLMAAAADKELRDEELAAIIAFVISRDEFDGIDEDHLRDYINERLRSFATGGIAARLESLIGDLVSVTERENAYGLAVSMALADGELADEEKSFLIQLRHALAMDEEHAARILSTLGHG